MAVVNYCGFAEKLKVIVLLFPGGLRSVNNCCMVPVSANVKTSARHKRSSSEFKMNSVLGLVPDGRHWTNWSNFSITFDFSSTHSDFCCCEAMKCLNIGRYPCQIEAPALMACNVEACHWPHVALIAQNGLLLYSITWFSFYLWSAAANTKASRSTLHNQREADWSQQTEFEALYLLQPHWPTPDNFSPMELRLRQMWQMWQHTCVWLGKCMNWCFPDCVVSWTGDLCQPGLSHHHCVALLQ